MNEVAVFKTTLDKLQERLAGEVKEILPDYFYKANTPRIYCKNGVSLSVQASEHHWCSPRINEGPYYEVEVWCVENYTVSEFPYSEEEPSAYVPIAAVALLIDNNGGFAE